MAVYQYTTSKGQTLKVSANTQADADRRARDTAAETGDSIRVSSSSTTIRPPTPAPAPTPSIQPPAVNTGATTRTISAQEYQFKPGETPDQYTARIASLRAGPGVVDRGTGAAITPPQAQQPTTPPAPRAATPPAPQPQQQQQAPTTPPAGTTPPAQVPPPTVALQPGANGAEVKKLQDYLVALGFMTAADVATGPGTYGPKTTAAVKALQERLGVDNSSGPGFFGPRTIQALSQSGIAPPSGAAAGATLGASTGEEQAPAGTTSEPEINQNYLEGSTNNLASLLSTVGINIAPQTSLKDMVKEISTLYGFDEVNSEIQKLDDDYVKEVAEINDNPWLSEALRSDKVKKTEAKYQEKRKLQTDRLALREDIVGKAVSLFNAEKSDEQQLLLKTLDAQLKSLNESEDSTTDIKEYNLAVSQGYGGSFLDWQKQSANLKRLNPSTVVVNTGAGEDAENQLLASRNQGPEADGTYADPNLYASLRSKSPLGAAEFDRRFSYLVNPASKKRLGIKEVSSDGSIDFNAVPAL